MAAKHEIHLDEQHVYNMVCYGPGTVYTDDDKLADVLQKSHDRVVKARTGAAPKVHVLANGILSAESVAAQVTQSATFTPADAEAQKAASDAVVNKQAADAAAAKKAAANPVK